MSEIKKLSKRDMDSLKNAAKVFGQWFKVLCEKPEMNEIENRREYLIALQDLENIIEKKEVE